MARRSEQAPKVSPEILAEIRKLHFFTKRATETGISGQYRSAYRGRGMEFEEVREYYPGMDIRSIDWKVTARSRKPFVKYYREERELTVMIAVDVSASTLTGTRNQLRDSLVAKVGAMLTMIALKNNDKVGLVTFSDKIETFHPPRKARTAVWRILHEVLEPRRRGRATDLAKALGFLHNVLHRSSIVFIVSDFIPLDMTAAPALSILGKRHDVTAISINDPADLALPNAGLVEVEDPESGERLLIDTGDRRVREAYQDRSSALVTGRRKLFLNSGIDAIELMTDRPFIPVLRKFFDKRSALSIHRTFYA